MSFYPYPCDGGNRVDSHAARGRETRSSEISLCSQHRGLPQVRSGGRFVGICKNFELSYPP